MRRQFGPSRGNRRPAVPKPGATPSERPARQRGGGGNKGAQGSPVVTATSVPTVTVTDSRTTTSGFKSPTAAKRAVKTQRRSTQRVRKIAARTSREPRKRAQKVTPPKRYDAPLPKPSKASRAYEPDPSKAVISSIPNPNAKPEVFQGLKTAGEPSRRELQKAAKKGALQVNRKGHVTTPRIRKVGGELKKARAAVRRSQPSLAGLSPEERAVVPLARKAHRKYPDIPVSVLMAQDKQESGFNAAAVSSAGAQGLSQFIPSTAASYGVKYGTGPKEKQSQVTGQAHLLHDQGFASDPQGALSAYSGGYAAGDYNNPILVDAEASYAALDKRGNPKALKQLRSTQSEAAKLGLKTAKPKASSFGPAPKKVVTRFKAAKVAMKEVEGLPYVWGGGHGSPTSSPTGGGLDCSGAVGYVLNKIGVMKGSLTSGDMGSVLKPGPGALTVFYNAEHTFLRLGNEYWGTSVGDSGAGGLGPHDAPSADYLASYNVGHVVGLGRKQALQLGFKNLGSGGSEAFPGMTLSQAGTTATINEGAGATMSGKPGFSKQPIKLTPLQKFNQTKKQLHNLGVGESSTTTSHPSGSVLSRLEAKYGVAA
jgi:Transglycosylase SLT domain